ncbi:MAG: phosphatidate cytidylyltransferase [Candidatus Saccharibacteria bacterium]|nr:phosphatidate cytidylyltransferase [Candidatus Saccharibacteria bacterium]
MIFILAVAVVFVLLIVAEVWWRTRPVHGEFSRKFVHITVGSFVAFWPWFLSWNQIRFLSLAFLIGISISKAFKIFRSIHSVGRPTWGEVFFALAVGLTTFITHDKWVFMAALLQMSLADGLAAVVGVQYGAANRYRILGHAKSLVGSLAFVIVSLAILLLFQDQSGVMVGVARLISLPLLGAAVENFGIAGLDNLFVPLLFAAALTH